MRWVKLIALLFLWAGFFVFFALVHLWISMLRLPNRWQIVNRLTQTFAFLIRTILNIKVTVVGDVGQVEQGGCLIISNHFSYVDGFVLISIFPMGFITYGEVKKWPVIGQWMALIGTIFINRERKNQVSLLVLEISRKLKEKANILLFPEGDSTNGERMLPFQTAPLAAPLRARSIIVPVTLVYKCVDDRPVSKANRDLIYFYGDMDFLPHFWKLLSLRSAEAMVTIQPKIECSRYEDNSAGRKRLALDCYNRVLGKRGKADPSREEDDSCTIQGEP